MQKLKPAARRFIAEEKLRYLICQHGLWNANKITIILRKLCKAEVERRRDIEEKEKAKGSAFAPKPRKTTRKRKPKPIEAPIKLKTHKKKKIRICDMI